MVDMKPIESNSIDALFTSHGLEHIFYHELPLALKEFKRVLKPDGFALITCPDLSCLGQLIAQGKILKPIYESPLGTITPMDILYGNSKALKEGRYTMSHKCGLTTNILSTLLVDSGFSQVGLISRKLRYDLWALATCQEWEKNLFEDLMRKYFPSSDKQY